RRRRRSAPAPDQRGVEPFARGEVDALRAGHRDDVVWLGAGARGRRRVLGLLGLLGLLRLLRLLPVARPAPEPGVPFEGAAIALGALGPAHAALVGGDGRAAADGAHWDGIDGRALRLQPDGL